MSIYILTEGRRTETKIYPNWLELLLPGYSRVDSVDKIDEFSYFLISGRGYPRILKKIKDSLKDIERYPSYNEFVVILDSEENTVDETKREVKDRVQKHKKELSIFDLNTNVIVQKRSIETWLLGNRNIFTSSPQNTTLSNYIKYYNVKKRDPEEMGNYKDHLSHASFHNRYLKLLLREKNIRYTKKFPKDTKDVYYLEQIIERVKDKPDHLTSFQEMLDCFKNIFRNRQKVS